MNSTRRALGATCDIAAVDKSSAPASCREQWEPGQETLAASCDSSEGRIVLPN
jgi:hypothetical protein